MGTKLAPWKGIPPDTKTYSHRAKDLEPALLESLKALGAEKVDTWYLHLPDHNTPVRSITVPRPPLVETND
jgi:aflatoxin B1 aldehyde reductase